MSRPLLPVRLAGLLLAAGLAAPVLAQEQATEAADEAAPAPPEELQGNWDLRVEGTTIFRFTIERTASGGWQGRWARPNSFNSNGDAFGNIRGPVKRTSSMAGNAIFELVELAFDDPRPGAVPDIFRFRLVGPDRVDMLYVGTPLAPYRLVRAGADDPLGDWESGRVYRRTAPGAGPAAPAPAPAEPAAPQVEVTREEPAAAEAAPRRIEPLPDGRLILGPQVRFLDLSRRAEDAGESGDEVAAASAEEDASENSAADESEAATEASEQAEEEAEVPSPPRIDAGFLDDL